MREELERHEVYEIIINGKPRKGVYLGKSRSPGILEPIHRILVRAIGDNRPLLYNFWGEEVIDGQIRPQGSSRSESRITDSEMRFIEEMLERRGI